MDVEYMLMVHLLLQNQQFAAKFFHLLNTLLVVLIHKLRIDQQLIYQLHFINYYLVQLFLLLLLMI